VSQRVDWSRRADYIRLNHAVQPEWANEAVSDEHALWLVPDAASQSGRSVRVVGYSPAAGAILTVILVDSDADPTERPDGKWWGTNAWVANRRDKRLYGEADR
jgi:hypothetical protein